MDMNFFAPYQGQKKEKKNENIYSYSIVSFFSVVIIGSLIWNTTNIILLNKEIKNYNEELNAPEIIEKIEKWDDIDNKTNVLEQYNEGLTNIITSLKTREVVTVELLNKLSSSLPSEVTFNSISINNKEISIQAVSSSREAIGEVQHNLKNIEDIGDVYISGISGDETYNFDIKCLLKDVE